MTLRKKTLLILGTTVLILTCLLITSLYYLLRSNVNRGEEQKAQLAINEALVVLDNDILDLSNQTSQLASDNNTKTLLQNPGSNRLKKVFSSAIMERKKISFALVFNKQGQVVHSTAYDHIKKTPTTLPHRLLEIITPQSFLLKHPLAKSLHSGVLTLPDELLLIASRPVLDSKLPDKINGTIISAQLLDYSKGYYPLQLHQMSVNIYRIDDKNSATDIRSILESISNKNPVIVKTLDAATIGYTLVNDIFGKPVLLIKATLPRLTFQQNNLMFKLFIIVLIITLVFATVFFLIMDRLVLARFASINSQVRNIAASNHFAGRITVDGKDDLTAMGMAINYLLISLEQTQKDLNESSQLHRLLPANMLDIVIQTDLQGIYKYISPSHQSILGHGTEKLLGKSFFDLIHPEDLKNVYDRFSELIRKQTAVKFKCRVHNSAGHYITLEAIMMPLYDDKTNLMGSVIAAHDSTLRKKSSEKA